MPIKKRKSIRASRLYTHSNVIDTVWVVNKNADLLEECFNRIKELEKRVEELEKGEQQ